jgi:hypothetical protein
MASGQYSRVRNNFQLLIQRGAGAGADIAELVQAVRFLIPLYSRLRERAVVSGNRPRVNQLKCQAQLKSGHVVSLGADIKRLVELICGRYRNRRRRRSRGRGRRCGSRGCCGTRSAAADCECRYKQGIALIGGRVFYRDGAIAVRAIGEHVKRNVVHSVYRGKNRARTASAVENTSFLRRRETEAR